MEEVSYECQVWVGPKVDDLDFGSDEWPRMAPTSVGNKEARLLLVIVEAHARMEPD